MSVSNCQCITYKRKSPAQAHYTSVRRSNSKKKKKKEEEEEERKKTKKKLRPELRSNIKKLNNARPICPRQQPGGIHSPACCLDKLGIC
ncbi:hypothetical protein OS493_026166 [Desmophyllum pertusum]|uniref:Uncharacterized protein n=1 Tax=Desmophyllum pertusum TaxID=174260 RepID=A0A9W9ZYP2_9CNID|nr:hypothetical protein OS493_026166 [Desmophyllum pertusum]